MQEAEKEVQEGIGNWQVRCSNKDLRFFKEVTSKFNMTAPQVVKLAFENLLLNQDKESESNKVLTEVDTIMTRLHNTIRSQILLNFEKEEQLKKQALEMETEQIALENERNLLESNLKSEYEEKMKKVEFEFHEKLGIQVGEFEERVSLKDGELLSLRELYEEFEAKYGRLEKEHSTLQQQYKNNLRLIEITDDRLLETKIKVKELEDKLQKQDVLFEKVRSLEIENAVLKTKNETLNQQLLKFEDIAVKNHEQKDLGVN
ncbi:hypothetical protein [Silvanigrella aquatica]|uniref:Uncharacterized protein n=1 Tax=Silvanigrella aquatica TaxID=1915309 RepID=A0A1L4D4X0_9BACT|nr:hypothetical protein [Silvanigrella aquatica]APJ05253.1 hypothetical protein AXG55_14620 [Silvanigrella aquatica]